MSLNIPSTYQQVVKDAIKIAETIEPKIGVLETDVGTLKTTVKKIDDSLKPTTDPTKAPGDASIIDGRFIVKGVTVVTTDQSVDSPPNSYKNNISYNIKKTNAIGLANTIGFNLDICLVMTAHRVDKAIMQIAYGDAAGGLMLRNSTSDTTWGDWILIGNSGIKAKKQFVEATTEPTDQDVGDYWMEPITV